MRHFFSMAMIAATLAASTGRSQDLTSFDVARSLNHEVGYYSFDGNGRLTTGKMQTIANSNALFFEDEVIQKEIELVDDQLPGYSAVIRDWNQSWQDTIEEIKKANQSERRSAEFNLQLLTENDRKSLEKMKNVLLPHQVAIVNELQFRCLFRVYGLNKLLENDELCQMLEVSEKERKKFKAATREIRIATAKRAVGAVADAIKTLVETLEDQEQKAFLQKWSHLFSKDNPVSVEELIIFLNPESYEWMRSELSPTKKLLARPSYQTGAAGNLQTKPGLKFAHEELNIFREFWKHRNFIDYLALTPDAESRLDAVVRASYQSSQVLLDLSIEGKTDPNIPFEVRRQQAQEASAAMDEESMNDIEAVLGSRGWDRVEEYADKINVASAGLVYDILEGDFSVQLELPPNERTRIQDSANVARENLIAASKEIEQFVVDQYLMLADEATGKKLKELLGTPVKNAPANVGLLLMH